MSAKDLDGNDWEGCLLLFATASSTVAFSSTAAGVLLGIEPLYLSLPDCI